MRIAVVEDNPKDMEELCGMIEDYLRLRKVSAEIVRFNSGDELLESFVSGNFACAFLDIYMDGKDGMETAREIYRLDPACRLIFATVSVSHAVTSYEVRAAWYLTKPFDSERLADAMDAACADALRDNLSIAVHINGDAFSIRLGEIFFVDCESRKSRLHLADRSLIIDESIKEILDSLASDERFLLCNRNTMVNMDHISLVEDDDFRLSSGALVPMKQRGRAVLKKAFLAWSLRELRREERL